MGRRDEELESLRKQGQKIGQLLQEGRKKNTPLFLSLAVDLPAPTSGLKTLSPSPSSPRSLIPSIPPTPLLLLPVITPNSLKQINRLPSVTASAVPASTVTAASAPTTVSVRTFLVFATWAGVCGLGSGWCEEADDDGPRGPPGTVRGSARVTGRRVKRMGIGLSRAGTETESGRAGRSAGWKLASVEVESGLVERERDLVEASCEVRMGDDRTSGDDFATISTAEGEATPAALADERTLGGTTESPSVEARVSVATTPGALVWKFAETLQFTRLPAADELETLSASSGEVGALEPLVLDGGVVTLDGSGSVADWSSTVDSGTVPLGKEEMSMSGVTGAFVPDVNLRLNVAELDAV